MTAPFDLRTLEVLTFGRSSVDLYPEQHNVALADVATFRKSIGGSPTNVAVAAARLGRRAALLNRVGDDPFGQYIRQGLRQFGVHDAFITTDPTPWLQGKHTIFGEVADDASKAVVDAIAAVPTGAQDRPKADVVLHSVDVVSV